MVISSKANQIKQGEFHPAFTMIEMIFVIVVLGILAAVAIPRLAASRDDAVLVKGKSQVSAIRSGISLLKSKRLMEGNTSPISELDNNMSTAENQPLFHGGADGNILEYPIYSKEGDGNWKKTTSPNGYTYYLNGGGVEFIYTSNTFDCNHTSTECVANKDCDCNLLTR
jgi:general secretion pathway protein G